MCSRIHFPTTKDLRTKMQPSASTGAARERRRRAALSRAGQHQRSSGRMLAAAGEGSLSVPRGARASCNKGLMIDLIAASTVPEPEMA